jgi:hypothetical protein
MLRVSVFVGDVSWCPDVFVEATMNAALGS